LANRSAKYLKFVGGRRKNEKETKEWFGRHIDKENPRDWGGMWRVVYRRGFPREKKNRRFKNKVGLRINV